MVRAWLVAQLLINHQDLIFSLFLLFNYRGASAKQSRNSSNASPFDCFENIPEKPPGSKKLQQATNNRFLASLRREDDKYKELCETIDKKTEMFILNDTRLIE